MLVAVFVAVALGTPVLVEVTVAVGVEVLAGEEGLDGLDFWEQATGSPMVKARQKRIKIFFFTFHLIDLFLKTAKNLIRRGSDTRRFDPADVLRPLFHLKIACVARIRIQKQALIVRRVGEIKHSLDGTGN